MKKLSYIPVFQERDSYDCVLACVSLILQTYGRQIDIDTLKKSPEILYTRNLSQRFITLQQAGIVLSTQKITSSLILANPLLFTVQSHGQEAISSDYFVSIQKGLTDDMSRSISLDMMRKYIESGGAVSVKIPNKNLIKTAIENDSFIIALCTTRLWYDGDPHFDFHAIVIVGYTQKGIIIFDPIEGEHVISDELFFFSLFSSAYADYDNGGLLIIYNKL